MRIRTAVMIISGMIAFAVVPFHLAAAGPKPGTCLRVANVESWDFLYIRERPDHLSRKVGAIRPDTRKKLVVSGKCTPVTTNKRKLWCKIRYNVLNDVYTSGYIKMYFTEEVGC